MLSPKREILHHFTRIAAFALFAFCCGYAIYLHATAKVLPYDDAFITYRYVKNLFEGRGLVYNPGQRVFGSSTPLYVVWLIALKVLIPFGDIPSLAARGNVIFLLATAFGFVFLLRELLNRTTVAVVAASLFLLRFDMLEISVSGNEPFLFCALALWSFYFLLKKKYLLSGTLAGLSIMARPEGVFCALLVGLVWLLFSRKKTAAFLASVMWPGLIWTAFAFAYYGNPIYHSLIAKMAPIYSLPPGFAMGAVFEKLKLWTTGSRRGAYMVGVTGVVALCGFLSRRRAHPCTWFVIPCFIGLIILFYGVANPIIFLWYLPIIFIGWFTFVLVGLTWFIETGLETFRKNTDFVKDSSLIHVMLMAVPLLFMALSTFFAWQKRYPPVLPGYFTDQRSQFRILTYRQAAEFINRIGYASDTVTTSEVGALGYYVRNHVYDSCGLVSPESIPFLPVPWGKRVGPYTGSVSVDFVKTVHSDWIVTMEIFAVESLFESPWFQKNYVLVARFPLTVKTFASEYVLIYHRR